MGRRMREEGRRGGSRGEVEEGGEREEGGGKGEEKKRGKTLYLLLFYPFSLISPLEREDEAALTAILISACCHKNM